MTEGARRTSADGGRERIVDFLAAIVPNRAIERIVLGLVLVLCIIGNLPWHLDNYDQAKQAYVSYEIAHGGSFWYQHTPRGDTATKPPLAGWISLAVYEVTGSWDIAWRLPGFLCTVGLLVLLAGEGRRMLPEGGTMLVTAAFGLNLLTPRISTLVRTDMMLTLWITICGWLIYRKLRSGETWTGWEKWTFFGAMAAAFFTKGPIIYAFILPGIFAYLLLAPRGSRGLIWSGWWTWAIPVGLFVAWGVIALMTNKEFYDDVVVKEFYSRFDQSLKSHEKQQAIWFYFPHLIHKFAPWSLLAIALPFASANVRRKVKSDPALLWLACWGIGGLLCMTFIPSKRVDRIFPVIPPLCLLLVAMIAACECGRKVRAWCGAALIGAICMAGGYFLTIVVVGYIDREDRMVEWGRRVQTAAGEERITVVKSDDEGMIIYGGGDRYVSPNRAVEDWKAGKIHAMVIQEDKIPAGTELPAPTLDGAGISKDGDILYLFFLRKH